MRHYYAIISHHEQRNRDAFYFEQQRRHFMLSIGWGRLNPFQLVGPREIQDQIRVNYPERVGTPNPWNGGISLSLFCHLVPGDVVFVRGVGKILDPVEIIDAPFYDQGNGHDHVDDYCTKVRFRPIIKRFTPVQTKVIPDPYYQNILHHGGSRLAMRSVRNSDGGWLLEFLENSQS